MVVYRHIRLDRNEVFYIGIGRNLERAHTKNRKNDMWKNIVSKTDYKVEILFDDIETWEEACEKEKEFIKLYGRRDLGLGTLVNMTDGGDGTLGRKVVHSEEVRKKISNTLTGHKGYMSGKNLTEDQKNKISLSKKGKKLSEDHKNKLSLSKKGKNKIIMLNIETGIYYTHSEAVFISGYSDRHFRKMINGYSLNKTKFRKV